MSDPEVHKPEKSADVDDVVGNANAGLDAAAAAGADVPGTAAETPERKPVDPDLAAFEEAEKDHPGLFSSPSPAPAPAPAPAWSASAASDDADGRTGSRADSDNRSDDKRFDNNPFDDSRFDTAPRTDGDSRADADATAVFVAPVIRDDDVRTDRRREDSGMTDAAYAPTADDTETRVVPSEPLVTTSAQAPQPIFVQAPEAPRDRGNRGTAGAIGLLATLVFAILYLGATLGLGAIAGDVTGENIGQAVVAPLVTWGFWTPVVVFFLGFWLLGAIINRARWGLWVVFGIIVGVIAYAGHILGQLFEAPFWNLNSAEGLELVGSQLLAPLAIAAFVFARELTIWFGAWVARSGARKTELNAEAQREYERTLEAGPTLSR